MKRVISLVIMMLMLISMPVLAEPTTEVTEEVVESIIFNLEYKEFDDETSSEVKNGLYDGETLLYAEGSDEMMTFLESIMLSAKDDTIYGMSKVVDTLPTRDNVELREWGLFLSKYSDKEVTEYPGGDISFKLNNDTYNIKSSKVAKNWVKDFVLPAIYDGILSENSNHPVDMYKLNIEAGKKLTELELDITNKNNYEKFYTVLPFTGKGTEAPDNFLIFNTGTYYGLALDTEYVKVLKGYHNESEYLVSVVAENPACANILAYITLPKNVSNLTLDGKSLKDMAIYKGLAVNLIDKKLKDTNILTTDNIELLYKDYSIDEEELILVSLTDSVVVVQPVYVEYFNKWGKDLNTSHSIDFTNFFMGNGTTVEITDMRDNITFNVDIANYIADDGLMSIRLDGRYMFGVYVRDDSMPYDRILKRLYGPDGASVVKEEELKKITESIEKDLKAQGRSEDFKAYMKAAGQSTFPVIIIPIILVVIIGVVLVIVMSSKKKKKSNIVSDDDLLFNPDDEEDDNY